VRRASRPWLRRVPFGAASVGSRRRRRSQKETATRVPPRAIPSPSEKRRTVGLARSGGWITQVAGFLKTPNTKFQYWIFVWVLKRSELRNRTGPAQLDLRAISKECNYKNSRSARDPAAQRPFCSVARTDLTPMRWPNIGTFWVEYWTVLGWPAGPRIAAPCKWERAHRFYSSKISFPFPSFAPSLPKHPFTKNERRVNLPRMHPHNLWNFGNLPNQGGCRRAGGPIFQKITASPPYRHLHAPPPSKPRRACGAART